MPTKRATGQKGQVVVCRNPECLMEFRKKRATQLHCSKKCTNRASFLRLLGKRRSEAAVTCPDCGSEFWVGVTPTAARGTAIGESQRGG